MNFAPWELRTLIWVLQAYIVLLVVSLVIPIVGPHNARLARIVTLIQIVAALLVLLTIIEFGLDLVHTDPRY